MPRDSAIRKEVFGYVEYLLYDYKHLKREIADKTDEIMHPHREDEGIKTGCAQVSTTELKAIKLLTSRRLQELTKIVRALDSVLGNMTDEYKELYNNKYINRMSKEQIMRVMHFEQATYYRKRKKLVHAVAKELGLM